MTVIRGSCFSFRVSFHSAIAAGFSARYACRIASPLIRMERNFKQPNVSG